MPILQSSSITDPKTKECKTCACPTCEGLECLCRPRFFAGQLLTDEALNNLEHYIVEKNKLHNRFLHGWGVVCGLEVVCNPCNAVTVRAGYALSPCGEDIVVCKDVPVDVCGLISQCTDKRRDWECEPFSSGHDLDCRDVEGDWILYVRYDEKTSRGITALKGGITASCCSSCSCGGSSGCGCGCHGRNGNGGSPQKQYATASAGSQKYGYRPAQAAVAAQCEPTLTCEGFVFEVGKLIPEPTKVVPGRGIVGTMADTRGEMIDRYNACILEFFRPLTDKPTGPNVTVAALYQWCCALKQKFRDDLFNHPVYNCRLADALNFSCPDPTQFTTVAAYDAELDKVLKQVIAVVAAEYLQYCICSSFLPSCPDSVCDPRVPLATVTVRKDRNGGCQIVRVCNLGKRRFVITFANLGYWFSFILAPLRVRFRKLLETICCQPFTFGIRQNPRLVAPSGLAPATLTTAEPVTNVPIHEVRAASSTTDKRGFKAFAGRVWENRTRTVNEQTLFLGAIGAKDEKGMPYLSETELSNPFLTMMVNRVAGPLLAKLPDHTLDTVKGTGTIFTAGGFADVVKVKPAAPAAETPEINELKTRVSDLQSTVERQSVMIEDLQKLVKKDQ